MSATIKFELLLVLLAGATLARVQTSGATAARGPAVQSAHARQPTYAANSGEETEAETPNERVRVTARGPIESFTQSGVKYILPNTYDGFSNDMSSAYANLAKLPGQSYAAITNGYSSLTQGAAESLDRLVSSTLERIRFSELVLARLEQSLQQSLQREEQILARLDELSRRPERLCRELANGAQMAASQAQQIQKEATNQVQQQPSSLVSKFSFGK